jgi:hypothetical protein
MDIDSREVVESVKRAVETEQEHSKRLNAVVSMTIAVIATIMAICQIKAGNVAQDMEVALTDKIDHWAYYQAKNAQEETAKAALLQLKLGRLSADKAQMAAYDDAITAYEGSIQHSQAKKEVLRSRANEAESSYLALNQIDDQFDVAEAGFALSMVLLAVTVLTNSWLLFWVAMVPASLGLLMGLSGFLGWSIHPEALIRALS